MFDEFGNPIGAADNAGNGGGEQPQSQSQPNNAGQEVDLDAFWNDPAAEGETPPADDSKEFTASLATQLQNMSFGGDLVTADMQEAIQQGDYSGLNKRLAEQQQTTVRQTLTMAIQIMNRLHGRVMTDVEGKINGTLSQRDQKDFITETFPSARNPQVRPQVEAVFNQALKLTKNDRKAAVDMTNVMLKTMATALGRDTGVIQDASSQQQGGPLVTLENLLSQQ